MAGSAPISPATGSGREHAVRGAPGGHCRGGLAKGDMVMITPDDLTFLRRAIGIATTAVTTGDDPYGSLLASPRTRPGHGRPDHHVHQLPALRHVQWCDRPFRARPRRLRPVDRAVGSAQSWF